MISDKRYTVLRDAFAVVLAMVDRDEGFVEAVARFDEAIAPYKLTREQRDLVWLVTEVLLRSSDDPNFRESVVERAVRRAGLGAA